VAAKNKAMMIPPAALAAFVIGVFLYYRPQAKQGNLPPLPNPGKYPGHIEDMKDRGHQFFEDPDFFLRKY
jgi:hypothetical protein